MPRPDLSRVPSYYHRYIDQVKGDDLAEALPFCQQELYSFLESLPESRWDYAYAEGKWTIKELVQHIIDADRIFAYRALTFARKDRTPLPGFEENDYANASDANRRTAKSLLNELQTVQQAALLLFNSFSEEQLAQEGIANGNSVSVAAIGFIMAGHALHHLQILKERYA
ncbi:MAG: hypothetical protein JWP88_1165 [Flaviaesturariibacter sp.]|nr:hypothetical protein [Flaviaesturariibacter sp.]